MTTDVSVPSPAEVAETSDAAAAAATATAATAAAATATAAAATATATAAAATATAAKPKAAPKFRGDRPIQTVGRRKEAIVRVRLMPGTGKITCNGRELEQYFPSKVAQQSVREPLVTAEKGEVLDVVANLRGGGVTGQAGALRLGIARALVELEIDDRPALKKAGFLTRDPRVKESKKYGLKKARKAPQYSKR